MLNRWWTAQSRRACPRLGQSRSGTGFPHDRTDDLCFALASLESEEVTWARPISSSPISRFALAALLIVINGAISVLLKLDLERRLLIAAACTIVQLLLIGFVLEWVFRLDRWYVVVAMMSVMTFVAGIAAIKRTSIRFPGIWARSVAATWASSWLMAALALTVIVGVRPWYTPQYAIPLLGMILGNTLNGVSLGLDRLGSELLGKRDQVECLLALGATRWEAARPLVQQAVKTGLIPTINAMMVVGIVSLPGMMTGQLLAGTSPVEAVKYQIVIMFLIASGTALGTVLVVLFSFRRLFNEDHQFESVLLRTK